MDHIGYSAEMLHKHRAVELQEIARIERFLHERKQRDALNWQQRRLGRARKTR